MRITVLSRKAFESMQAPVEPHIVVSINCPGEPPAKFAQTNSMLGRVNCFFWDVDKMHYSVVDQLTGEITEQPMEACNHHDAKRIIDLVDANPSALHRGKEQVCRRCSSLAPCVERRQHNNLQ